MRYRGRLATWLALAVCLWSFEPVRADGVALLAVFRTNGEPVQRMAFSTDGTRLAASLSSWTIDEHQTVKTIPGEVHVWDIARKAIICSVKREKTDFTHLWLSADAGVLVTSDHGIGPVDGLVKVPLWTGSRSRVGYQAWDANTGKPIGKNIAPARPGEFTVAAMSPDGRWLATAYNGLVTGEKSSPLNSFHVGQIDVWDLQNHKIVWKLPGVSHKGRVTWADALAFSPDGRRLVHFRSDAGGPASEIGNVTPDRRSRTAKLLRILSLEPGKEEPTVTTVESQFATASGVVEWLSAGKAFVLRRGRSIEVVDAGNYKPQTAFTLAAPMQQRFPNFNVAEIPRDWFEPQSTLGADGSRLAAHFIHVREDQEVRENFVTIWDARARTTLGSIQFPDEAIDPRRNKPVGYNDLMGFTAVRLALSGDGRRLAASDRTGVVRVYDVSKLSGLVKLTNDAAEPPAGADIAAVRGQYERSLAEARKLLLANLDQLMESLGKKTMPDARAAFERLKAERDRFEKNGLVPWSEPTWDAVARYLDTLARVHAKFVSQIPPAEMPEDLRELMAAQVVARWKHRRAQDPPIVLLANGKVNNLDSENTWSFSKGRLTLRWKNANAPGGFWIDVCPLSSDGLRYSGENQNRTPIHATLVTEVP